MKDKFNDMLVYCISKMFNYKIYKSALFNFIITSIIFTLIFILTSVVFVKDFSINIPNGFLTQFTIPIIISGIALVYMIIIGTFDIVELIKGSTKSYKLRLYESIEKTNKAVSAITANMLIFCSISILTVFFIANVFSINIDILYSAVIVFLTYYFLISTFVIIAIVDSSKHTLSILEYSLKSIYKHKVQTFTLFLLINALVLYFIFVTMQNIVPIVGQITFILLYPTVIGMYCAIISQIESKF